MDIFLMKRIFITAIVIFLGVVMKAQDSTLSLRQSVETAFSNNLEVKQNDLELQNASVNLKQSRANLLPSLFGNLNNGVNQGRSIDPFTNSYINQQLNYANFGLNTDVTVFSGGRLHNLVRQNALNHKAARMDLQQIKDQLTLNVILAYLQILNNEDQLIQAKQQAFITRNQAERLEILDKDGAIAPALLYDLKGQLANDELTIISTQNALNTAILNLSQLMNVPYNRNLKVEQIYADQFVEYESSPDEIYQLATKHLAIVKAADLRRQGAEKSVKVAKSYFYPTIGFGANLFTNYSSAARKDNLLSTAQVTSGDYIEISGNKVPVYTTQRTYNSERINYFSQFNNNYSTSISIGLYVPIFNAFRAKYQVALARIALKNSEYQAETTNIQLKQSIEQAHFTMNAAYERYLALVQQVENFTRSFGAAEVRFNAGVITQVDYLIAKNNVDRANTNLIIAKYDYLVRTKVLDYYKGKTLW